MKHMNYIAAIFLGLSIFLFILYLAAYQYSKNIKNTRYGKENPQDWMFHNFYLKVYNALFGISDPTEVAVKLGIEVEKYYQSCKIVRKKPNAKKLIVHHIYGIAALAVSAILCLCVDMVFLYPGILLFAYFTFYDQQKLNHIAESKRLQIENELPRFLDLLKPELEVGLPIESAIYIICSKYDSLLSEELLLALQEMKLGVSSWVEAIEQVAQKYNVDSLSDFSMDISTAYKKGVPVLKSVERKVVEIRKTHLLTVKERASKTTNTILLPIVVFQFIPMLAYIMIPMLMQAKLGFR